MESTEHPHTGPGTSLQQRQNGSANGINRLNPGPWADTSRKQPEYRKAFDRHKTFHIEAGKVANLINAGGYTEAEAALANGTAHASASGEVGGALMALKKAVSL